MFVVVSLVLGGRRLAVVLWRDQADPIGALEHRCPVIGIAGLVVGLQPACSTVLKRHWAVQLENWSNVTHSEGLDQGDHFIGE